MIRHAIGRLHSALQRALRPIGAFNNRLLLTVAFFLCFAPVGILRRLRRKDPLRRRYDTEAITYRISREGEKSIDLARPY